MIIANPQNYWLSSNALTFTLNANGSAEYLFANSSPGAAILCYIKGVEGLEYDAGHNYRRWPLVVSLTHFSTPSAKYIYVKIPKSAATSEYASVIFPSELLDIYGKNEAGDQIGSTDSYYIWLQGIISASEVHGVLQDRYMQEPIQWGTLSSDEAIDAGGYNAWWSYSSVDEIVTFLKSIVMKAGTTFHNIILGNKELTGVATAETSDDYIDSDYLVVTPNYLKSKYLSRQKDDTAEGYIGFIQGLWVGVKDLFGIAANGDAKVNGLSVNGDANIAGQLVVKSSKQDTIASSNYNGDGIGDTGFRLTNDDGSGRSKLTVDRLYVRQDFTTETLQVKRSYVTSGNHVDSAAANTISRTDYLQLNSSTGVYELIGYETVKVPFTVKQRLLAILKWQLSDVFSRTRTIRKPVSVGDIDRIRCYFLANDGNKRIDNNWMVGDLARCQTFNIDGSWQRNTWLTSGGTHTGNVFWWRKVVAVSSAPVEIDGLSYHYFDVAMGDCALGSHIPAEEDEVCQWGHVSNPDRMNLIVHEVTGSDAPAIKSYEGIYCYDLTKSWFGGNTKKMNLSPKTEYLFNGRKFRIETDYGVQPISVDRGEWDSIDQEPDDYEPTEMVRKCYYGDKVTHNGSYWRCILSNNGEHWVDDSGQYISDATYDSLTPEEKATCTRKQNYAIDEPTENSDEWERQVERGTDAQDFEWAYIRTKTNHAPVISSDNTYVDSNSKGYTSDGHLPHVNGNENIENNLNRYECTNRPKGVDGTWKYEWEIKRTKGAAVEGQRSWDFYQGAMTLHNNLAESAFIIDIDNDNDLFSTDIDSKVLVEQTRQTTVSLYDGSAQQTLTSLTATLTYEDDTSVPSSVATVVATPSTGIVAVTVKQNNTSNTHDEIKANITAVCSKGTKTITFTLRKVMGGAPGLNPIIYQLAPTQKVFQFSRTADNTLTPSSRSSQINVAKTEGNTTNILTTAQTGITYSWGFDESSTAQATGRAVGTAISISNTLADSHYQVWVELSTGDRETLPIVKDGASPNTNILLRTIFDKGIDFVKEKWTGAFNYIHIDGASDTPIEGHKCIRINASTLPTGEYADFNQNVIARVKPATWYTLSFNYFSTGGSTDKFLETFVWSGASEYTAIDVSEGMYIDGVHQSAAATRGDGCVQWPSDWTGKRHSVTFKTVGTFNTDYVNILFRCNSGGQAAICMPKLEEGKTATAYMANDDDLIGKDGWMITANPANVILTQALTNASASFTTATVSFTAKKGSVSATISSIGTPTSEEFVVAKKGSTGDDAKKVLVSSPKTHGDPAAYYTEGSFEVTLNVVDPDTGNTVTFSVTVLCYANPMGVWKTEIEGDVETSVAQKITYGYDHETGAVGSLEAVGKYIRSSEENISMLTKKVDNGKNLLSGVLLGTYWKSTSATTLNAVRHDITVNNGVFNCATGDSYIMSPAFAIEANKYYTASFISGGNYTFTIVADNGTPTGISIASQGGGGGGKLSFSFRSATAYSAVYVFFGVASLQQPQVEEGSTATDFEADTNELSSQIRQTAENIELSVNDGLQRTGIDIENGQIKLDADKVTVSGNLRSASVGTLGASGNKIEIDDSTFKVYNSAGIVGLEIGWDSDGNPFLVLRDRTGRDGYKLTYNSIGNASANFTNDEFSAMKLYQLVNGRTYDNLEINEFFRARRDPSETLIDPNYYMYSAAKNLSTDVYKMDDYDYDGSHREYTDGKTFDTNDLSDVLGAFPDNYMIPDGYYINDMITGDNHQGRFGPVYQKNLYQAVQGVLSVVGSICFIGVYDDREEEWNYYFTRDIEGTGTWTTIFVASDYLF